MKLRFVIMILILFVSLIFTSCFQPFTDKIIGHAVIVDNFKDKNPLEGVYIEIEHTEDEGYNYYVIGSATTDPKGISIWTLDLNLQFLLLMPGL